jgi:hypothetical protein
MPFSNDDMGKGTALLATSVQPGEGWGAKSKEDILADISRAAEAMKVNGEPVPAEIKVLRDPNLPPGTMVVSDDVYKMLKGGA